MNFQFRSEQVLIWRILIGWEAICENIIGIQVSKTELLNHIKDAFQLDENKHQQLLDIATMKEVGVC